MKISDFKYSTWNLLSDNSAVFVLSNNDHGLVQTLRDGKWDEKYEGMLTGAEKMVKKMTKETDVPHVVFTFPDSKRSSHAMFVAPLVKHPEEMEFQDPHSLPPFEEFDEADAIPL